MNNHLTYILLTIFITLFIIAAIWMIKNKNQTDNFVKNDTEYFIQITDVHIDPLYNPNFSSEIQVCRNEEDLKLACGTPVNEDPKFNKSEVDKYGRYYCDPPMSLVDSFANHFKGSGAKFVAFTGDLIAHGLPSYTDNCEQMYYYYKKIGDRFAEIFKGKKVIFSIGNNDLMPHNEMYPIWMQRITDLFISYGWVPEEQRADFLNIGCYYVDIDSKLKVLSLNTSGLNSVNKSDITLQTGILGWFETQLQNAKKEGKVVYITTHYPIGSKTLSEGVSIDLVKIISKYTDIIKLNICGHVNYGDFRVFKDDKGKLVTSMLVCPGMSPRYPNNPTYRRFYINKDWIPVDYEDWIINLSLANNKNDDSWNRLYSFKDTYNLPLTNEGILKLAKNISYGEGDIFNKYMLYRSAGYSGNRSPKYYYCLMTEQGMENQAKCLWPEGRSYSYAPDGEGDF